MSQIEVFTAEDFKNWLAIHHQKETQVALIIYKRHTGIPFPSHRELLDTAICFGWVDTVIKRLDADRYIRNFVRRNKNSRWSENTLGYAKLLIAEKRMTPYGLKWYREGLQKKTYDQDIPKNPELPSEVRKALQTVKGAKAGFEKLPPSTTKMLLRWYLSAKQEKTRLKRIQAIIEQALTRYRKS